MLLTITIVYYMSFQITKIRAAAVPIGSGMGEKKKYFSKDNYDELEKQFQEEVLQDTELNEIEREKRGSIFSNDHQGCWGASAGLARPFQLKRFRDGNHNFLCTQFCTQAGYNVAATRGTFCGCSYSLPIPMITSAGLEPFVRACNFSCPGSRAHTLRVPCHHNECCGGPFGYTTSLLSELDTTHIMMMRIWEELRFRVWSVNQVLRMKRSTGLTKIEDNIIQSADSNFIETDLEHQVDYDDSSREKRTFCRLDCDKQTGMCKFDELRQPHCDCDYGWGGRDCTHKCIKDCSGHGKCYSSDEGQECRCDTGFEGEHCEIQTCFKKCFNEGTCVNIKEIPMCQCLSGWGGHDCSKKCKLRCSKNGHCIYEDFGPICWCPAGWGGLTCNNKCKKRCYNGGYCYVKNNKEQCKCKPHFTGPDCERATRYELFCHSIGIFGDINTLVQPRIMCPKNSVISIIRASYTRNVDDVCTDSCQANAAKHTDSRRKRFQYSLCNECKKCQVCTDFKTNLTFVKELCHNKPMCKIEWNSVIFETAFKVDACPDISKYIEFEYDCKPNHRWMDPCMGKPCKNKGACFGDINTQTYTCSCIDGWKGNKCEIEPFNPCTSNPCLSDATCVPNFGIQTFTCICKPGYSGVTCDIPPGFVNVELNRPMTLSSCFPSAIEVHSVCVGPADSLNCWQRYLNKTVNGYDTKSIDGNTTLDSCKRFCLAERTFDCRAIKWSNNTYTCILSVISKQYSEDKFIVSTYQNFYERIPCSTGTSPDSKNVCRDGWTNYNDRCYLILATTADFETATMQCRKESAELTSIESAMQEAQIIKLMEEKSIDYLWIGMKNPAGNFEVWMDGSEVIFQTTFSKIYDDETEKCVNIKHVKLINTTSTEWHDTDCSQQYHFICQQKQLSESEDGETCYNDERALQRVMRVCNGRRTCDLCPSKIFAPIDEMIIPAAPKTKPAKVPYRKDCWEKVKDKKSTNAHKQKNDISLRLCLKICETTTEFGCSAIIYHPTERRCDFIKTSLANNAAIYANGSGVYYGKIPCLSCYEAVKVKAISKDAEGSKWNEVLTDTLREHCTAVCGNQFPKCKSVTYYPGIQKCQMSDLTKNDVRNPSDFYTTDETDAVYLEKVACNNRVTLSYSCVNFYESVACNNNSLEMVCQTGTINVLLGWYGRLDKNVCPNERDSDTNCYTSVTHKMREYCYGENKCVLDVTTLDIAWLDPCLGTNKYLSAKFECVVESEGESSLCPKDYKYNAVTKSCYKLVKQALEWHKAKDICWQEGFNGGTAEMKGSLVSISTLAEQLIVYDFVKTALKNTTKNIWIGLTDENYERKQNRDGWEWVNGEIYVDNWNYWYDDKSVIAESMPVKPNEPKGGDTADYVYMSMAYKGLWFNAIEATQTAWFVCEYTPAPNPCKPLYVYHAQQRACYHISLKLLTWETANRECNRDEAFLTSIHSTSEQLFLADFIRFVSNNNNGQYWVGMRNSLWVDDDSYRNVTYTYWYPGTKGSTSGCTYIEAEHGNRWLSTNCEEKLYSVCKYRPPYVVQLSIDVLLAEKTDEGDWRRCSIQEERNGNIFYYCSKTDPVKGSKFMYLNLIKTDREIVESPGKNMKPLGKYDFMLENPLRFPQIMYREFTITTTVEESGKVESGHSIASTISASFKKSTKFTANLAESLGGTMMAGSSVWIVLMFELGGSKKTRKQMGMGFAKSTSVEASMLRGLSSGTERKTSVTVSERFGVTLQVPKQSIAQFNLFKETYPLSIKWKSLFLMEGFCKVTWRVYNYTITREVDIVQILTNQQRQISVIGKLDMSDRARIVAMLSIKNRLNIGEEVSTRRLTDKETKEQTMAVNSTPKKRSVRYSRAKRSTNYY